MTDGFLGSGWAFPVAVDARGAVRRSTGGEEAVRHAIWTILSTSPGERVMRPDFGCGIHDHVFGVNDAATANAITREVRNALTVWEPRIELLDVFATPDPADPHRLLIEINYRLRSTNSRFNLVYPFYLE
jgi:phage baseplate assembly protein W